MFNFISNGLNTLVNTASTLTLGLGPSQTAPPSLLLQSLTAGGTVTLPKINAVFPTAPGTPNTTPGISDGFPITIKQMTAFPTTIAAASGDTLDSLVPVINGIGNTITLIANAAGSTWWEAAPLARTTVRYVTGSGTLAATDKYLIYTGTAGAVALLAPANYQIGEVYQVINNSAGSITITPASGSIQTVAAQTLATLTSSRIITDGTNFFF